MYLLNGFVTAIVEYEQGLVAGCAEKPNCKQTGLYFVKKGEEVLLMKKGVFNITKLCNKLPNFLVIRCSD